MFDDIDTAAIQMADAMVRAKFGKRWGVTSLNQFYAMVRDMVRMGGAPSWQRADQQRRDTRIFFEGDELMVAVPMRWPVTHEAVEAITTLDMFLRIIANGNTGSWHVKKRGVVTMQPMQRQGSGIASIARLITGAGPGQRAGVLDGDPFNLRPHNLRIDMRADAKRKDGTPLPPPRWSRYDTRREARRRSYLEPQRA